MTTYINTVISTVSSSINISAHFEWRIIVSIAVWVSTSCIVAELLGYWLHRLLHSSVISILSRSHMRHHLILYGPLHKQRSDEYLDATLGRPSLGNIGLEWLIPAALMITAIALLFNVVHVSIGYQLLSFGTMLAWSFVMFSFMHDAMHVDGFWMEKNRWLRRWFLAARRFHDIHHRELNDSGSMNRNFGIGFYFFDRLFGTFSEKPKPFNHHGYAAAREKFNNLCSLSTPWPTRKGLYKS